MQPRETILVHDEPYELLGHPLYHVAHPDEACEPGQLCEQCAIARNQKTGTIVLLWLCGGINWSLSRTNLMELPHAA